MEKPTTTTHGPGEPPPHGHAVLSSPAAIGAHLSEAAPRPDSPSGATFTPLGWQIQRFGDDWVMRDASGRVVIRTRRLLGAQALAQAAAELVLQMKEGGVRS